jgi:hypothetical protein
MLTKAQLFDTPPQAQAGQHRHGPVLQVRADVSAASGAPADCQNPLRSFGNLRQNTRFPA